MRLDMIDLTWSPDGRYIGVATIKGRTNAIHILQANSLELVNTIHLKDTGANKISFLSDNLHILGTLKSATDHWVCAWNILTGAVTQTYTDSEVVEHQWACSLSVSNDGKKVFATIPNVGGRLWDQTSGRILQRFPRGDFGSMSGDGRYVLTDAAEAGAHGHAWLYDAESGVRLHWLKTSGYPSIHVELDSNGDYACVTQETCWIFSTASGELLARFVENDDPCDVVFSSNTHFLLCANAEGTVSQWDIRNTTRVAVFPVDTQEAVSITYSPDNSAFAVATLGGTVSTWSLQSRKQLQRWAYEAIHSLKN